MGPSFGSPVNLATAPWAEIPEFGEDPPSAVMAFVSTAWHLPLLVHFASTPGTVAHKGHQVFSGAAGFGTAGRIPSIRIGSLGFDFEAFAVAPGAVPPIAFDPAPAAAAALRKRGFSVVDPSGRTAPWAVQHGFGDRPVAPLAVISGLEGGPVLAPKVGQSHRLPVAPRGDGLAGRTLSVRVPKGSRSDPLEGLRHVAGVLEALALIDFHAAPQKCNRLQGKAPFEAVKVGRRPLVGPFRQGTGKHAVKDETQRKDV